MKKIKEIKKSETLETSIEDLIDLGGIEFFCEELSYLMRINAKGRIVFFESNGTILVELDRKKDMEKIKLLRSTYEKMLQISFSVMSEATIHTGHTHKLDILKNRCYRFLEIVKGLPKQTLT